MIKHILTYGFISTILLSSAQNLSKEEKSAVKSELKALMKNPEKYIVLKNESQEKTKIIGDQQEDINKLKSQVAISNMEYLKLKDSVQSATNTPTVTKSQTNIPTGNYRVQIGLFNNYDISELLASPKAIFHEIISGSHRYSIGNFNTLEEAINFKDQIKKLGIKDAFITEYAEGTRNMSFTEDNYSNTQNNTLTKNSNNTNNNKKVNFTADEIKSMTNTTSVQTNDLGTNGTNSNSNSNKTTRKSSSSDGDSVIYMDN